MPKPVPNWRRALRSLAPLSVLALDPHLTWHEKTSLLAGLGVAWVCVPAFALGMNWSVRRRSLEWGDIWTLYEKVLPAYFLVCLVAGLVIEVTHPKPSEVLSCYGACSGKIDGVSTIVAIAAGAAVLAILLSLVLGASLRTLAGSRLAQAAGAAHGTRRRAAGNRWAP
jgi:hypothetical protein